ncbi:hypothetical protein LXT21_06845 [Myxococcus sp. K38C18041901]|uniref:hypothetical protein n=1 Tax=Myxococcus guangdongensis TaxID=2906760 RepID=UPI0020A7418C|nr:hypothetical protein [Myxococcus guangdongensis]MCP3058483.1 hypothetical protein [Myxococcus guangdongensis]
MRSWNMKGLWLAGALLAGCGGTEALDGQAEAAAPELAQTEARLEYNEDLHCIVMTSSVRCNSGIQMYAYWSAELGHYFIPRNVCGSRGPIVCPL